MIFITGSNGFIGHSLSKSLVLSDRKVRGVVRSKSYAFHSKNFNKILVDEIDEKTDWLSILSGCDIVIHCAAKNNNTHKIDELNSFRSINTSITKNLAEQSAKVGVKRFIFISSALVMGTNTNNRLAFLNSDKPNPSENYSISKFEAEEELWKISKNTGLEVVVVRPPIVYGCGVKGNLKRLIKLVNMGIPMPFGLLKNERSLIGLDNLIDFLIKCIDHPNAAGKTFLVSDGEDLSTADLIRYMQLAAKKPNFLIPIPVFFLKFMSMFIGKQKEINKLVSSFKLETSYARKELNWKPPWNVKEGIIKMMNCK